MVAPARPCASAKRAEVLQRAGLLCGCIVLAYANTFAVPFLLDDAFNVANNPSIRDLGHFGTVLHAVNSTTIAGRPLLNLSFAFNYALGRLDVAGYHGVNLAIHCLAALTLCGLIRRSIELARLDRCLPPLPFAFLVAALWSLHPLQTESVTYISERAESLMGLFYLLTLYGFARHLQSPSSPGWLPLSIAACYAGMLTKQAMVTAPVLVLLYDRAFSAANFATLWRQRKAYHLAIGGSWVLLALLMAFLCVRPGSIGFHTHVRPLTYGLTEAKVILEYVKLSFWPRRLVFDYGPDFYPPQPWAFFGLALVVSAGVALSAAAWRWSKPAAFLASAFFVLLAPTSSVIPVAFQPMAESRMYLPLAALVTLGASVTWRYLSHWASLGLIAAAAACAGLSHHRNHVYRDGLRLWEDTIAKYPHTSRGQNVLGLALAQAGRRNEAVEHLREATRIMPDNAVLYCNLADVLLGIDGRTEEAIVAYRQALHLAPQQTLAHFGLANALAHGNSHLPEAVDEYRAAVRLDPEFAPAHANLAATLIRLNRREDAIKELGIAHSLDPNLPSAAFGFGQLQRGQPGRQLAVVPPPAPLFER